MSSMTPSSPRLPSPPPAAEIQVTPNSPSGGPAATLQATEMEQSVIDAHSKRRIHPGTKASEMAAGPPVVPLNELDSAFSLQEHLAALHYSYTQQNTCPIDRTTALQLAQPPAGVDRTLWLYELCRFLISKCNSIIVGFLFDSPPCSATTCPEMRASEWQFLCAVHEQPKSCCAIDYCCHTLDWAANVVSDQKIFPSRFVVVNDSQSKGIGLKNLVNVFRRLHRIFAHAWFQHRDVFWAVENETGLYVFFKLVCDLYELLPAENYKLPPEAEGLEPEEEEKQEENVVTAPTILKPPTSEQTVRADGDSPVDDGHLSTSRTNTRRHIRSSPSTGSAVTTVIEADEEESEHLAKGMDELSLSNMASSPEPMKGSFQAAEARPNTDNRSLDEIFDSKHDEPELPPNDEGKLKEITPEKKRKGTTPEQGNPDVTEKADNRAGELVTETVEAEASDEAMPGKSDSHKTEKSKEKSEDAITKDVFTKKKAEKKGNDKAGDKAGNEENKEKSEKAKKTEKAEKAEKPEKIETTENAEKAEVSLETTAAAEATETKDNTE